VTTDFINGDYDYALAVILQPDGKLVAAGYIAFYGDWDFALARYNPDGSLDTSFDGDGKTTTNFGGSYDYAFALTQQPDGRLVAAGASGTQPWADGDFALARYNPDGSLDLSFAGDGRLTTDFAGGSDEGHTLALQPDGRIVVAGVAHNGSSYDFALARYDARIGGFDYNPNGQFDWLTAGEVATDTFTYIVSDGALTDTATVSITINGIAAGYTTFLPVINKR
jgi:uncharacterized delta-60 repeat protein